MSAEAIAIVAVGVTLLAVLVPLMLALNSGVRSEVANVRSDVTVLRSDVADVRSDVTVLRSDLADVRSDVTVLRSDLTDVRSGLADVRRDLQAQGERVARIEGRLDALAPVMTPMRPAAPAEPAPAPMGGIP